MMKKLIGLAMVLCLTLGLAACGGNETPVIEPATTFAAGTTINGIDVSGQTPEEAKDTLRAIPGQYSFTLKLGENTYTATGMDLKLTFNELVEPQTLLDEQNNDAARLAFTVEDLFSADMTALVSQVELTYAPVETEVVVEETAEEAANEEEGETSSEEDASEEAVTTVILVDPYAAKNAYLQYDETAMEYVIVADVDGLSVDFDVVAEQCLTAVTELQPELELDMTQFVVKAELTADSQAMKDALDNANACLNLELTYTFTPTGGATSSYTLSREDLASIYYLADDLTMQVDEEILGSLVSTLDSKYSVAGEKTKFKTTGGSYINISVATAGQSVNSEGLYNDMLECLTNQVGGTRVAPYVQKSDSGNGYWGGNYVEVDLTRQHLWLYKNGTCIVSCPIVSGCVANGTTTPTGSFTIFAKNRDRYLRGYNIDGTRYESWVSYFMPFSGGCGLHDATWRGDRLGGTIYYYEGSHGCVGMTLTNAEKVYNNVSIGTHVVIYGGISKSQLPTKDPTISFAQSSYTIEVGQTISLGIETDSDGGYSLAYSASGVVGFGGGDVITGVGVGQVVVGCYSNASPTYKPGVRNVIVTVVPAGTLTKEQNIQVSIGTNLLTAGGAATQITVSGNQTTPVFTSGNAAVATVDANGKVTPVGVGTATITVNCPGTTGYKAAVATLTVTVAAQEKVPVDKSISASVGSDVLMQDGTTQITVSGAENRNLTYISNSSMVSVDAGGKVTVVGNPTADTQVVITVVAAGNSDYNQAQATVILTIKPVNGSGGGESGGSSTPDSGNSGSSGSTDSSSGTGSESGSGSAAVSGAAESGSESTVSDSTVGEGE